MGLDCSKAQLCDKRKKDRSQNLIVDQNLTYLRLLLLYLAKTHKLS